MSKHSEDYKIDRTGWKPGPWDREPDKVVWIDPATKLDCMIVRNGFGAWCGYVGVTEQHALFGKDYNDVEADCHGGLTYAAACHGHICHPSPTKTWWFGFDCGHWQDYAPCAALATMRGTYRDEAYVKAEVTQLAEQIGRQS